MTDEQRTWNDDRSGWDVIGPCWTCGARIAYFTDEDGTPRDIRQVDVVREPVGTDGEPGMPVEARDELWLRLRPVRGMLQVQMAVFIEGRGWLHTRRGIVVHGAVPPWTDEESAVFEIRHGLRAMRHRFEEDSRADGAYR